MSAALDRLRREAHGRERAAVIVHHGDSREGSFCPRLHQLHLGLVRHGGGQQAIGYPHRLVARSRDVIANDGSRE